MKICPKCQASFSFEQGSCVKCGYELTAINGFTAFAPHAEDKSEGFTSEFYETYAYLEAGHF